MQQTLIVALIGGLFNLCSSQASSPSMGEFAGTEKRDVNIEFGRSASTLRGTSSAQRESMSHASKSRVESSQVGASASKSTGFATSSSNLPTRSMSRMSASDPNKSKLQAQSSQSRSTPAEISAYGLSKARSRSVGSRSTSMSQSKSASATASNSRSGKSRSLAEVLHFSDDTEGDHSQPMKQTSRSVSGKSVAGAKAPTTINFKSADDTTDLIRLALMANKDSKDGKLPKMINFEETRTIRVRTDKK